MAYDPKSYLDQALKTGFQSVYSQPSSLETGEAPQYQGDVATFGNVQVRPLSEAVYEGTGDAAYQVGTTPAGHMVSVPLTGKYEGYFRNDIYDTSGNFLRTTLTEPNKDPYGLRDLAQMGLMAASFGALGPLGKLASQGISGISALQSGDPLRILGAVANVPGVDSAIPAELKSLAGYASKAGSLKSALEGDPSAIFRELVNLDKSGVPFSKLADITGEDAIEGFFAPGGEGYDAPPIPPMELNQFLEANVEDPATVEALMRQYYPDLFPLDQSITVTGTRATPPANSIRDIGNVTRVSPDEKLDIPDISVPDLAAGLTPVKGGAPKPKLPGVKLPTPGTRPTTPGAKSGTGSDALLAALFGAMGSQEQDRQPAMPNVARGTPESPFGLMYDLRG